MRVFVVGSTGILGYHLVPLLLRQGIAVRALARSTDKARGLAAAGAEVVQGDLLAPESAVQLASWLKGCDATVHAATSIPRDPTLPGAWSANTRLRTQGTRILLDASLAAGVQRYVQQSIIMAYPDSGDRWIDESVPLDTAPGRAAVTAPVVEMEALVRAVPPERLQWCILRGGSFVGNGTAQDDLIARLRAGTETVPCDGRYYISPIHVADMAAAVAAALAAPAGSILNIVDAPVRYGDYVDRLAAQIGAPPPPRDPARACPPSWRCSNRAARTILGWSPTHGIGITGG